MISYEIHRSRIIKYADEIVSQRLHLLPIHDSMTYNLITRTQEGDWPWRKLFCYARSNHRLIGYAYLASLGPMKNQNIRISLWESKIRIDLASFGIFVNARYRHRGIANELLRQLALQKDLPNSILAAEHIMGLVKQYFPDCDYLTPR